MNETRPQSSWLMPLVIAVGVLATVLLALLSAQLDTLRLSESNPPPPFSIVTNRLTPTPRPTELLPTVTRASRFTPSPTLELPTDSEIFAQPASCDAAPEGWEPYTIGANESLTLIAAQAQERVSTVAAANCLTAHAPLFAGQVVLLPLPPCQPPFDWPRYRVQRGDTLGSISGRVSSSVNALMRANCLKDDRIDAFALLYVPRLPAAPTDTPTATSTLTAVPTHTPTSNPSNTPQPTSTPTLTAVPTHTPTALPATPTVPLIPTDTPTATVSSTPTSSPTPSSTPTAIFTPTATSTPSNTPTTASTATPTNTPQPPTLTPTPTNTPEPPTSTPTNTPQPPTLTPTPTNTPEPPTSTPTNTPEPSTATPTPTPTS